MAVLSAWRAYATQRSRRRVEAQLQVDGDVGAVERLGLFEASQAQHWGVWTAKCEEQSK